MPGSSESRTPAGPEPARPPIRLALWGLSRMLDDILVQLVSDASDVAIIARVAAGDDPAEVASAADVLVCAAPDADVRRRWTERLRRQPPPAILNLGVDARAGLLLALRPYEQPLGAVSGAGLLELLRALRG